MRDDYYAYKGHSHFSPGGCLFFFVFWGLIIAQSTGHLVIAPDAGIHFQNWLHSWVIWK